MKNFFYPIPIYVTRKNANGEIGQVTVGAGFAAWTIFLFTLNCLAWGVIGLYEAVRVFV